MTTTTTTPPLTPDQRDQLWEAIQGLDQHEVLVYDEDADTVQTVRLSSLEILLDEHTAPPEPPRVLSAEALLRLGALTVDGDQISALRGILRELEETYRKVLTLEGPEPLIQGLLDRDTQLAHLGRQVADQKTAGRLLREFMRMALQGSDHASLKRIGDATKTGKIEEVLQLMSGSVADARQLRLHGSTLGPMASPEAAAEEARERWEESRKREEKG